MALYILDALDKDGLLKRTPEQSTIFELGQLITILNNERIFDSREKRKYQLAKIDAFLREQDLLADDGVRYFTTVLDYWIGANNPPRATGTIIAFGLKPEYESGLEQRSDTVDRILQSEVVRDMLRMDNRYEDHTYDYKAFMAWRYENPLRKNLQLSFLAEAAYAYRTIDREVRLFLDYYPGTAPADSTEWSADIGGWAFGLMLDFSLGYYPDSRNEFVLSMRPGVDVFNAQIDFEEVKDLECDSDIWELLSDIRWQHWFNLRSSFTLRYGLEWSFAAQCDLFNGYQESPHEDKTTIFNQTVTAYYRHTFF